jgi:multidrug efflux system outer membrane protein
MRKLSPLALLLVTACMVGPDYEQPKLDLPSVWSQEEAAKTTAADVQHEAVQKDWWNEFKDPTLTALVEEGLKANADLALAAARVAEARAVLRLNDAQLYPNISAQANATRVGPGEESRAGATTGGKPYNDFTAAAVLDYEIDLWGKLRRASESAQAQLLSQQANRDAVRLAVASDIATGYFNLLALNAQEKVTRSTITSRKTSFDYQRKQYDVGAIDVLTFKRAEAELAAAEATLPLIEQGRIEQQHALGVLQGRAPKELIEKPLTSTQNIAALPVPPHMPSAAPSSLLQRRPDIAASEQALIAANAEIGVARAAYYPTLSLSALLGVASADIDNLLKGSAKTWQLGAGGAMPILDFGRTGANVDAAEARKEQALVSYQQTVRLAFVDVANALSAVRTSENRTQAQIRQVKANEETVRVAGLRYNAGYSTQLDQLDAQRQLFAAQLESIAAMQDRLAATVTLYKALGGGWNEPAAAKTAAPVPVAEPVPAANTSAPTAAEESAKPAENQPAAVPFKTGPSEPAPAPMPFQRARP